MSQLPDKLYLHNDEKYSTLTDHLLYEKCSAEFLENKIENYTEYIPIYRKKEAVQSTINKACEWLKTHINDYLVKGRDIDYMFDDFKKAMEE